MSPSVDDVDLEQRELPEYLKDLRDEADDPEVGFFGPDSLFWKFGRENILGLGGPSAILLQLAHPMVAAGVSDHSDFYHDPMGRLERTFRIVHRIIFGDRDQAIEAAAKVWVVHEAVKGELPEDVGPYDKGESYDANQPDLLMWVHATLLDQTLVGYERYVAPLDRQTKEEYYQESKIFGRLFGIPESELPEDYSAFEDYYETMVRTTLQTGEQGKELKAQLFSQNRLMGIPAEFFAGAMLPEPAREAFDIRWNPLFELVDNRLCAATKLFVQTLPPELRFVNKYRYRMMELDHGKNMSSSLSYLLNFLSNTQRFARKILQTTRSITKIGALGS